VEFVGGVVRTWHLMWVFVLCCVDFELCWDFVCGVVGFCVVSCGLCVLC